MYFQEWHKWAQTDSISTDQAYVWARVMQYLPSIQTLKLPILFHIIFTEIGFGQALLPWSDLEPQSSWQNIEFTGV